MPCHLFVGISVVTSQTNLLSGAVLSKNVSLLKLVLSTYGVFILPHSLSDKYKLPFSLTVFVAPPTFNSKGNDSLVESKNSFLSTTEVEAFTPL